MTRYAYCERILRQVYGEVPTDDAEITINLVNNWLGDAIAAAAKQNYIESIKIDGIAYVNNSFYTTFKGLSISKDDSDNFLYSVTLPQIPIGIGKNEGISTIQFKKNGQTSLTAIPMSANQWAYRNGMRRIPTKILYCSEGNVAQIDTTIQLNTYTATVKMVSGGDSSDLNSLINIPDDYFGLITEYVSKQLMIENNQQKDTTNDGEQNR